jgi:NodT family efflux transporter outer membrane factor (OMF) lipoprotein
MARQIGASAFVIVLGALAGCRVGPEFHPPQLPPGAAGSLVSVDATAETSAAPPDAWWRLYQDPRLDGLLEEAFRANADLAVAEANLAAARALVAGARAARTPNTTVVAGGIYGRDAVTDEILELGGHAPSNTWLFDDIFEVSYEVDLFGRVRRTIEAARADAAAVAAVRDSMRVTVAAETTRAYALICGLGEELAVARHSVEVVSRQSEITVNRNEAGANSRFDVVRAQALVAQVRAAVPPLEGQRRAALFELAALLGRTPANAPTDALECVRPPQLRNLFPVGDGAALLKRRPDVRQAEARVAAATARIGIATANLYPRISLTGLYGGAAPELSLLPKDAGLTWGIGPSISWDFPNQAGARARLRGAKASAAAALAGFDSVVLTALEETERSLAIYGSELDRRQAIAEAKDKARQAFDMAREQFLAGAIANLDILTAEQSLVAADAAAAASDAAIVQDQIAVFKALGGGWQFAARLDTRPIGGAAMGEP